MIIQQTFTVNAPRDTVAEFLMNITELRPCIPGLETVEEVGTARYRGTLKVHVGPIKTNFQGDITLDGGMAPARLSASGQGRDRASGTSVQVTFTADLLETIEAATTVTAVADVILRGRIAQFGGGVIKATAEEIVREFAREVNARLTPSVDEGGDGRSAPLAGNASPMLPSPPPAAEEESPRKLTARVITGLLFRSIWRRFTKRLRKPALADQAGDVR